MATTDLKLDEPGSLPRPGPIGRAVRLGFGFLCLWYVISLLARVIWGWELYLFSHLGLAFILPANSGYSAIWSSESSPVSKTRWWSERSSLIWMQKEFMLICYPSVVPHRWLDFRLEYRTLLIPIGFGTAFIVLGMVFDPKHGFIG